MRGNAGVSLHIETGEQAMRQSLPRTCSINMPLDVLGPFEIRIVQNLLVYQIM